MTANTTPLPKVVDGIGRRSRIDLHHPAEKAIRDALIAVESVGADPLLTDAVTALGKAKDLVADWLEGGQKPEPPRVLTLDEQVAQMREKWPQALVQAREYEACGRKYADHLVTIPDFPLPPGYSRPTCTVYFVVPAGYPYAPPERFYTDAVLVDGVGLPYYARELMTEAGFGCSPENMGGFPAPKGTVIWFWKVTAWNIWQNTLKTYVSVIRARLDRVDAEPSWR